MFPRRYATCSIALASVIASMIPTGVAHAAPLCLGRRATIVGTQGPDRLRGTSRPDVISALGGADTIKGAGGDDLICGGGKRDLIVGGGGHDRVQAGSGSDSIFGGAGHDTIAAGPGSDLADGGGGDDDITLAGGFFNVVSGGAGHDSISGGSILDVVSYAGATQGVTVDLSAGTATGDGSDALTGIDAVDGSGFDDTIRGDSATNFLSGAEGNDTIESGGNVGTLDSPDTIFVRSAFDVLSGDLSLFGFGLDEDVGDDTFIGGAGANAVVYAGASGGVNVDLATGTATGQGSDSLTDIQMVIGTQFNDTLRGNDEVNAIEGEGGSDTIDGRGGQDIAMFVDADRVDADLTTGTAISRYAGENQDGSSTLMSMEDLWGSFGNDTLDGGPLANRIFGMEGKDSITGSAGDDHLDGGKGNADALDGGLGSDTCLNGETVTSCEAELAPEVTDQEADARSSEQARRSPRRDQSCDQSHKNRATEQRGSRLEKGSTLLGGHRGIGDETRAVNERPATALTRGRPDVVEVSALPARPPHLLPLDREGRTDAFIRALTWVTGDHSEATTERLRETHAAKIQLFLGRCRP